jgi:hypothetical protein
MTGTDVVGTVAGEVALLADFGLAPTAALAAASPGARQFLGLANVTEGQMVDLLPTMTIRAMTQRCSPDQRRSWSKECASTDRL